MTHKLFILLLLSGSLCAGQVAPTDSAEQQTAGCPSGPGPLPEGAATACPPAANPAPGAENYPAPGAENNLIPGAENNAVPGAENMGNPVSGRQGFVRSEARAPVVPAAQQPRNPVFGPITTRTEFEIFADEEAGLLLPVYGRRIFDQAPRDFTPLDNIPVPADYVLGAGDELLIHAWGKIDLDTHLVVDRNGQIFVPRVGTLTVAGLRYEQLESFIHSAIAQLYKDFDVSVTLGQLRSIQILVVGSARQPGTYTISSMSTLADALFVCGGPSATGSMRHILLRRDGHDVVDFDIYDLLRRGDKSHDVQLLPGDVVYIPPAGPQIAVIGSVSEPGIYELKGDEALASALGDAGGVTSLADEKRILLERVENHEQRQVESFAVDDSGLKQVLRDGDLLRVYPLSPRFGNAVTLRGNVAQPGRYVWREGMRVSDLIPSRQFLLTRNYWNQQNFLVPAGKGNPFGLTPEQLTAPPTESAAATASRTQAQQALSNPSRETSFEAARNTEEINWDYAAIERLDEHDLSTHLIAFNLGNAIDNPTSADNQKLQAGDVVTIFSEKDTPLPTDKHAAFVRVDGEVNAPGVYRIEPGETLRDLVAHAGGITSHAYLYASVLTRVSTRLAEELEIRQSTAQMQKELLSRNAAASSVPGANTAEQQAQMGAQQALIAQLAAVQPSGRIVLQMKPEAQQLEDIPAFPLEDGDTYYVPPVMNTIQVSGAVYNENAFRYQQRKRLKSYLYDAGGPTRQADTRRIFLVRADGSVITNQSHGEFWHSDLDGTVLLPGDAIIVPPKLKGPSTFMQQLPFFTQILSQTALTGAVIGTAY